MAMGKPSRDWTQIYAIYGSDEWQTVAFLLFHAAAFSSVAVILLLYFAPTLVSLHALLPSLPIPFLRSAAGFAGAVAALTAVCLLYAAAAVLHSSLALRWEVAQRMVAAVPDWSGVRTALDVGCGRGVLLNSVAARMRKEGIGGRVVGLVDSRRRSESETAVAVLRRAGAEGVGEQVTCREGEARALPFPDGYFDVALSAAGGGSSEAEEERGRVICELVRVLKPGGVGVVWDISTNQQHHHHHQLREMRMEDIRVSERITAFLAATHIVSFRKPLVAMPPPPPPPQPNSLDWRTNIYY